MEQFIKWFIERNSALQNKSSKQPVFFKPAKVTERTGE